MTEGLSFRRAEPGDAGSLARVALGAKSHWGYPLDWLELWRSGLEPAPEEIRKHWFLVCEFGGCILGFVAVVKDLPGKGEIEHLWVRPDWMGRGIGRSLIERAARWARQQGIEELKIVSDPGARPFYESLGARKVGIQPSVPPPRQLPVLVLDLKNPLLPRRAHGCTGPSAAPARDGSGASLGIPSAPTGAGGSGDEILVREISPEERPWMREFLLQEAGALRMVSRGRLHDVLQLPALVATVRGEREAVLTYRRDGDDIEIVTLHARFPSRGLGSRLLEAAREQARSKGCRRVWLITTNDNEPAIRFYTRRRMSLVAIHRGAILEARILKPEIPTQGVDGRPIEDELEFEYIIGPGNPTGIDFASRPKG